MNRQEKKTPQRKTFKEKIISISAVIVIIIGIIVIIIGIWKFFELILMLKDLIIK